MTHSAQSLRTRDASLDLLRIVIMLYIVCGHCIFHGEMTESAGITGYNALLLTLVEGFTNVHVNCFVLISGYFLSERDTFKFKKLFSLYAQVWFWSVFLYAIFALTGYTPFGAKELIKACLPFTQQQYWFFTTYLLLYMVSPFLNILIRAMDRRQHLTLLLVYFGVFVFLQNLVFWRDFTLVGAHDPLHFMFLYLAAAYMRRYPHSAHRHRWGRIYVGSCLLAAAYKYAVSYITTPIFGEPVGETLCSGYNSVFTVLGSIAFFAFFRDLRIDNKKLAAVITFIAPLTFGVYLIHDNNYMRPFLWKTLLDSAQFAGSPCCVPLVIVTGIAVFAACALPEYLRRKLFERLPINHYIAVWGDKVSSFAERCVTRMLKEKV